MVLSHQAVMFLFRYVPACDMGVVIKIRWMNITRTANIADTPMQSGPDSIILHVFSPPMEIYVRLSLNTSP